jgi:phenol hydroxylase P0 protein
LFDPAKRFVRVTRLREDGFVEFDFAVGEQEIYVEMILPARAFDEFCALNHVTFLDKATSVRIEEDAAINWRLSDVNAAIARGGLGGKNKTEN